MDSDIKILLIVFGIMIAISAIIVFIALYVSFWKDNNHTDRRSASELIKLCNLPNCKIRSFYRASVYLEIKGKEHQFGFRNYRSYLIFKHWQRHNNTRAVDDEFAQLCKIANNE